MARCGPDQVRTRQKTSGKTTPTPGRFAAAPAAAPGRRLIYRSIIFPCFTGSRPSVRFIHGIAFKGLSVRRRDARQKKEQAPKGKRHVRDTRSTDESDRQP